MDDGERADGRTKKRVGDGESVSADAVGWIYYVDVALRLGLSVAETDGFTPGMVTDLAIQRMNQRAEEANQAEKQADQEDYDAF